MLFVPSKAAERAAWRDELRATLALGWPLVLGNVAQTALTTTDVIVLGRLGATELAAGTLGVNLYFGPLLFAIGLVTATSPMMATALGARRHSVREVRRTFRQGLWSAAVIALPCWLLLWNSENVLLALGQAPRLAAEAQSFLRVLQWGVLPALGFVVLRAFVSAVGRPLWATMVTLAAILFNVAANWIFVFGHLGMPAMGLRGSGLATALSNSFMFVSLALIVARDRHFRRYHLFGRWWRRDAPRLAALWRLGLPIGASLAFEVTVFNAAAFFMGWLDTVAIAAHAIALQIATITFMVPLGIGQAATVRVGLARGAGDAAAVTRAGWTAFGLAVAFMTAMSALMVLAPRPLIGLFIEAADRANAGVADLAAAFLVWAAVFQVADGIQVTTAGMLRGLQDTRAPMLYAAAGYWGIGMTTSLALAFSAGFGGVGIWMGLAAGVVAVAVALMARWLRRERLGLIS